MEMGVCLLCGRNWIFTHNYRWGSELQVFKKVRNFLKVIFCHDAVYKGPLLCLQTHKVTKFSYVLTYLLTYLLHGAESFLRS